TRRPASQVGRSGWLRMALAGAMGAALVAELLPAPRFVEPLAQPPGFFTDGTLAHAGALAEQPNLSNRAMYFQTLHGRPVLWGELSRDNPAGPLLAFLRPGPSPRQQEIFDAGRNWLCAAAAVGLTHVVRYQPASPRAPAGTTLLSAEPDAALYRIDDPGEDQTCVVLGNGWPATGKLDDGTFYRWTGQVARLGLLRRSSGGATLPLAIPSL